MKFRLQVGSLAALWKSGFLLRMFWQFSPKRPGKVLLLKIFLSQSRKMVNNPIFQKTTWTTTGETSGDVVGYLIHEPTSKTGSTRNDFGGATDFEIEFEVHVEE